MARYHFNVYPIAVDDFDSALTLLQNYYRDYPDEGSSKFPFHYMDAYSVKELSFVLRSLPEDISYMVRKLYENHHCFFSVWLIPSFLSSSGVDYLIHENLIDLVKCSRDVGYYQLKETLDNLPYNYHYIIQRYYE